MVVYDLWADEFGDWSRTEALQLWATKAVDDVLVPWDCSRGPYGGAVRPRTPCA